MPSPLRRRSIVPPYSRPFRRMLVPVSRKPGARRPAISRPDPPGAMRTPSPRPAAATARVTSARAGSPRQAGQPPRSAISRPVPRTSTTRHALRDGHPDRGPGRGRLRRRRPAASTPRSARHGQPERHREEQRRGQPHRRLEQVEDQREHDAQDERGGQGKVERPVPALDVDVAGQAPQPGHAPDERQHHADQGDQQAQDDEGLADVAHPSKSPGCARPGAAGVRPRCA